MFENLLTFLPETKIGVFASGGTDSTLLLYLLMRENILAQKKLVVFTIPKADGASTYALSVMDEIADRLKVEPPTLFLVGDTALHHSVVVQRAWQSVAARHIVERIFIADNVTPPELLPGETPIRLRSPNPILIQPFFDATKDQLIQAYYDLGIEDLLQYTHTCTELYDSECGECWQCGERKWAFKKIAKVDPLHPHG